MRLFSLVQSPIAVRGPLRRPFQLSGSKGLKLRKPTRKIRNIGFHLQNPVHIRGPFF